MAFSEAVECVSGLCGGIGGDGAGVDDGEVWMPGVRFGGFEAGVLEQGVDLLGFVLCDFAADGDDLIGTHGAGL